MLIERSRQQTPMLAEELVVTGFSGQTSTPAWLSQPDALALLEQTQASANLTRDERLIALQQGLEELALLGNELERIAKERATRLRESHMRVRTQTGGGSVHVRPASPPDILGLYILLPSLN